MSDKLTKYINKLSPRLPNSSEDSFLPNLSNGFSIDTISQFNDLVGMDWEVASNMVTNNKVFRRSYKILSEDMEKPPRIQEIDLGSHSESLDGRYFYKITHYFVEDTYSSQQPFFKWKRERLKFEQEVLYHNKITNELRWERNINKKIVIPDDQAYGSEKGSVYKEYEDLEDILNLPISVNKCWGLQVESDGEFIIEYRGEQVFKGFKSHKLSPLLSTDIKITLVNNKNHTGSKTISPIPTNTNNNKDDYYNGSNKDGIRNNNNNNNNNNNESSNSGNSKSSISIPYPTVVLPTYLVCKLYGTEEPKPLPIGRKMMPLGEDIKYRETLIHASHVKESDRYKPPIPGNFDYTFNNMIDKSKLPVVEKYGDRIKGNSKWI